MSLATPTQQVSDRSFRRGAIMGLTIAESFVLLVFCLLLLFTLWQFNTLREAEREKVAVEDPAAVKLAAELKADGTLQAVIDLKAKNIDIREFSGFAEADEMMRWMTEPERRRLMKGLARLEETDIVTLANAVEVPKTIPNLDFLQDDLLLQALQALAGFSKEKRQLFLEAATEDRLAAMQAMAEAGISPDTPGFTKAADFIAEAATDPALLDLAAMLASLSPKTREAMRRLGQSGGLEALGDDVDLAARLAEAEGALRGISGALVEAAEAEAKLARSLRSTLGGIVAEVDGQILDDGSIVLPEDVVFEQGSARIRPKLQEFLAQACPPWMELLRTSGLDIGSAEIQGHASREWRAGTPDDLAYRNNLQLSQERSRNVLNYCLGQLKEPATAAWSREHAIAVGYSSSRPIVSEGEINDELSRRVVFSIGLDRKKLLDAVGERSSRTLVSNLQKGEIFGGPARVIDGDTLDIEGLKVRLSGIDAPEKGQTCTGSSGAQVNCGTESAVALSDLIGSSHVSCSHETVDRYGRSVATCKVHGKDLGAAMVDAGKARAFVQYSQAYVANELAAKAEGRGLWQGSFEAPWDYRKE